MKADNLNNGHMPYLFIIQISSVDTRYSCPNLIFSLNPIKVMLKYTTGW